MRRAYVTRGLSGYELVVQSVPGWVVIAEQAAGTTCAVTGHVLCHPREWMFALGWGREDDGMLRHSLGGTLFGLGQRMLCVGWRRLVREYMQPLARHEVARYFPDALDEDDEASRRPLSPTTG